MNKTTVGNIYYYKDSIAERLIIMYLDISKEYFNAHYTLIIDYE